MNDSLPPQRRGAPSAAGRGGQQRGAGASGPGRGMTPTQGAEAAERRLNLPCFTAGQNVAGLFGCVACQFQIRNRSVLPTCPDCGEIIWAYLDSGPRPMPVGETQVARPADAQPATVVQEGVKLDGPAPVTVQEGVKLQP